MYMFGRFITFRQCFKAALLVFSTFNVLILRTIFTKPQKLWTLSKLMAAAFNEQVSRDPLPTVSISDLLSKSMASQLLVDLGTATMITHAEMLFLCALIRDRKPKRILEIGTYDGATTYHMALNSDPDCQVTTIDLPPDYDPFREIERDPSTRYAETQWIVSRQAGRERYRGTDVEHKIIQIYADSTQLDFATEFSESFDLVFIDGSHDYDHVRKDSLNALRRLKPGGIILWHDCGPMPEITFGVRAEVLELRKQYDIKRIEGTSLAVFVAEDEVCNRIENSSVRAATIGMKGH